MTLKRMLSLSLTQKILEMEGNSPNHLISR